MSALLHYASIYTTKRNSWKLRWGKGDNLSAHVGLDTWFHDGDQGNPLREERVKWRLNLFWPSSERAINVE